MNTLRKDVVQAGGDMGKVSPEGFPALNMLNTKYIIFPGAENRTIPVENPYAFGNAWFVNNVKYVDNANEEIEAIDKVDLQETALVDAKFKSELNNVENAYKDSLSSITLTSYEPNHLIYKTSLTKDGVAVFSEIYYPGWEAYIDGKEVPHGRADYILRVMNIPAGEHTVEFTFDPKSLHMTETIAYIALAILLIGALIGIALSFRGKKGGKKN